MLGWDTEEEIRSIMTFLKLFLRSLVRQQTNTPHFFLRIYFQLALHVSALRPWSHAVAYCTKPKSARPNFTFTHKSESKIRCKQKFTKILLWKKLTPSGVTRLPPQLSLSSIVLRPLNADIFSSSVDTSPPPDDQDRAGWNFRQESHEVHETNCWHGEIEREIAKD